MTVFCRDCIYQVKPSGGYENHPDSLCTQEEKLNYVTGEITHYLCKEKNHRGECSVFNQKGE